MSYICHICFQTHGNIYKRVDDYILTYPYVTYIEISFINKKSKASREEGIRDKQMHKGNAGSQQVHPGTVHLDGNQRYASKTVRCYFLDIRLSKITYFSVSLFTKLILLRHKKTPNDHFCSLFSSSFSKLLNTPLWK